MSPWDVLGWFLVALVTIVCGLFGLALCGAALESRRRARRRNRVAAVRRLRDYSEHGQQQTTEPLADAARAYFTGRRDGP